MTYDETGKQSVRFLGKYLIYTDSQTAYYSHGDNQMYMTPLFNFSGLDGFNDLSILVECDGRILLPDDALLEYEQIGSYKTVWFEVLNRSLGVSGDNTAS